MKSAAKTSVIFVFAVAFLATSACRRETRDENPDTPQPPATPSTAAPAPTTASTTDHAEVFRRAFWRQPTPADRILQAERRVHPDDGSWRWFIQLHPSPELLTALRDPETFGLLRLPPGAAPRPWPTSPDAPPAWFPALAVLTAADFEILQASTTGLTILYHAADNVLFATDSGTAFAPPVR